MSDTNVSRRLVAVFAADVEGYSRLMGADEVGTLKGLTERRAILDKLVGEHGVTAQTVACERRVGGRVSDGDCEDTASSRDGEGRSSTPYSGRFESYWRSARMVHRHKT